MKITKLSAKGRSLPDGGHGAPGEKIENLQLPYKLKSSQQGMTLIELAVVMAMIAGLSAIAILASRNSNNRIILQRDAIGISVAIQNARQNAIGAVLDKRTSPQSRPCGWGIHFNKNTGQYFLFADNPGGNNCNSGRDYVMANDNATCELNSECRSSFTLNSGIRFDAASDVTDIVFDPPLPDINIQGASGSQTKGSIVLTTQDGLTKARIDVNILGQVTIQ